MSRFNWTDSSTATQVSTATATAMACPAGVGSFQPSAGGFVVSGPWAEIYRLAYERALAMNAPSRFQKMMEPCWN